MFGPRRGYDAIGEPSVSNADKPRVQPVKVDPKAIKRRPVVAVFMSDVAGLLRQRAHVPGLGAHGAHAGGHGCGDYRVQYEERLVASAGVGVATGRDLLRGPRFRAILRAGSRDPPEGAGPLRGQERARRAGDRFELGGVLEHPHPFGGVVALGDRVDGV